MTSIRPSSQTFYKEGWIQQKIEEVREQCGTANSGEAGDKQYAEVCRRVVGALGAIAMRPSEALHCIRQAARCMALLYHHAPGSQHKVSLPKRASASFARSVA